MEMRLAALEGTEAAMGTASGMSAILMMCMGLLKAGDHVVCSRSMFGSTIKLIGSDLAKFGVESSFVSQTDLKEWQAAIRPNTTPVVCRNAHQPPDRGVRHSGLGRHGAQRRGFAGVDNCFATPALQRPAAMGADIIMHSGTKYLDGQGRVMAGALCASQQ